MLRAGSGLAGVERRGEDMKRLTMFGDPESLDHDHVGGKARNLANLAARGFNVPPAFIVSTQVYSYVFAEAGLDQQIVDLATSFDYDDAVSLERQTAEVRDLVLGVDVPDDLQREIVVAYEDLAAAAPVAVRSSGVAEDLAESSFAGQHDTYLNVVGGAGVVDAVKRCWASAWTSRAVAYRHQGGYAHGQGLAVIVQAMVQADVSGVMFTANPMTADTTEIVVNASGGLGEAIVSGVTNPDQIRLRKSDLEVVERIKGSKEVEIVADPDGPGGTVQRKASDERRDGWALSDEHLISLAQVGRRIEAAYGGMPQDVEWAFSGETLCVLQSRDITGAEFKWEEEVDGWQTLEAAPDAVWSRGFADEFWTGAVTPLFYSIRAREFTECHERISKLWGFDDLARIRRFRFHDSEVYLNLDNESSFVRHTVPKAWRLAAMGYFPEKIKEEAASWDFSVTGYLGVHARILGLDRDQGINRWLEVLTDYMENRIEEADGLPDEQLRLLDDRELVRYLDRQISFATELLYAMWSGFFIHGAGALGLLGMLLAKWYDGDNAMIFGDLISGTSQRTKTFEENLALWEFAEAVREDDDLLARVEGDSAEEFFAVVASRPQTAAAERYRAICADHGHRGHADRDFYFARRAEDPTVDFAVLRSLLTADGQSDPEQNESDLVAVRERAIEDVTQRFAAKPFGGLRVELFKVLMGYVDRFLTVRDDERHFIDRVTFSKKRALREIDRRLNEREVLEGPDDFFFLTKEELVEALSGTAALRLVRAKVSGRRQAFDRFNRKEAVPPMYLVGDREADELAPAQPEGEGDGRLTGLGTSRGRTEATARVIRDLKDIGRVQYGEILVTNSTDPAWTPVFMVISGLVLETGGMLAHGSCLSREYGLPAVTIPNAMGRISDGARIALDADRGEVVIIDEEGVDGGDEHDLLEAASQ
ncbi:MAG: PEP/pyruvate-binding domain-containing protein [Solirubrobacterales bacterium]